MFQTAAITPEQFTTFGELLKYLRHRAGLTQRELSLAVGYSEGHIRRLEKNERVADAAAIAARFVPELDLQQAPEWVARLLELAATSHVPSRPQSGKTNHLTPPHNFPLQLTSFIGREQALAEITYALTKAESDRIVRLMTLTGPGGCGKTRLALKAAGNLLDHFSDGVFFVNLAPLANAEIMPYTIAAVLGVPEKNGEAIRVTLTNHLQDSNVLLILDNCEHLIDACANMADRLLHACPKLKILATSREALGIAGEVPYRVPSLSLPNENDVSLESFSRSEAVRLFVDRAVTLQPTFTVNRQNAPAFAQICLRLDGIPLALELAAARIPFLSVEQIAQKLDDRFRLLTGGSRLALPRQQTLSATIDWSYGLLTPAERILFHRLAVFVGGWTLEAAEAVAAGGELAASQVLDLLSRLVAKSLVTAQEHHGAVRYQFLETIRVYAHDRLQFSGEAHVVQQRHLDFFLRLARDTHTWIFGRFRWGSPTPTDARAAENRYEEELDNFRGALAWSLGGHAPEKGLELAAALLWFWEINNYVGEGNEWLRRALAVGSQAPPAIRAYALIGACVTNDLRGNYEAAIAFGEASSVIYRELGDKPQLATALGVLARACGDQGNQERAIALIKESLQLFREIGDDGCVSACLNTLAMARQRQGDYEGSVADLEESLVLARKTQEDRAITNTLGLFARVYRMRGDFAQATLIYNEVMAASWELRELFRLAFGLEFYAVLATMQHQAERAARLWGAARALREESGLPRPTSQKDYAEYELDAQRQMDVQTYAHLYGEGQAMPLQQAVEYALTAPIPGLVSAPKPQSLRNDTAKQAFGGLTAREHAVALLVAQGKSNREIAEQLVLSERTVEKHIGNILSKLNFHSRTQLAAWVIEQDWLKHQV